MTQTPSYIISNNVR